jgi:translation initiation factor 2 subunit 1
MNVDEITLPEPWELVVATITRVVPYGAYATLDEYNHVEGLLHISELSTRWVKNIKDHVREGQKIVLKVLRVDPDKLHIDLSLRRVSDMERKKKLLQWKQENRSRKILETVAESIGISSVDAYEKIGIPLEDHFGSIHLGMEQTVKIGEEALLKIGIPQQWATVLTQLVKSKISLPQVKISGILELKSNKPDGVSLLKKAFSKAKNFKKPNNSDIQIYVTGTPMYRIEVTANSYKVAESLLEKSTQRAIKMMEDNGGEGKFIRKS